MHRLDGEIELIRMSSRLPRPLLCARSTAYNAFRNADVRGGDQVAVKDVGEG